MNKRNIDYMSPEDIKDLRTTMRLTQVRFAEALGTTTTTVSRWEHGVVTPSKVYVREIKKLQGKYANKLRKQYGIELS